MHLTASDKSSLLRLASSLPVGDEARRAILSGLKRAAFEVPKAGDILVASSVGRDFPPGANVFYKVLGYKRTEGFVVQPLVAVEVPNTDPHNRHMVVPGNPEGSPEIVEMAKKGPYRNSLHLGFGTMSSPHYGRAVPFQGDDRIWAIAVKKRLAIPLQGLTENQAISDACSKMDMVTSLLAAAVEGGVGEADKFEIRKSFQALSNLVSSVLKR